MASHIAPGQAAIGEAFLIIWSLLIVVSFKYAFLVPSRQVVEVGREVRI